MRSTVLILAGALALSGATLHAQTTLPAQPPVGATAGGRHHGMRGMLLRGLSLSTEQRARLKAIHTRYRDERRSMRGTGTSTGASTDSAGRAAFRSQARAMHEREMADVRNLLTPAQQATFDRNVAEWRAQRAAGRNGRRAAR